MANNKVSVVMCTYNGEKYISEQIESILSQTFTDFEFIISDDGSSDNTLNIIEEYARVNKNIKVLHASKNLGYIKNFEKAINYSNGEYIALSDQDDWWHPEKIAISIDALDKTEYDLVYCNSIFTDNNLKPKGYSISSLKNMISSRNPLHLLMDNCVSGHASMFKRTLFESSIPFPSKIPHDWWIAYCATQNKGIYYIDNELVKYRIHEENTISLSRKMSKKDKDFIKKERLKEFYNKCYDSLPAKIKIYKILKTYSNYSLLNNLNRVFYFTIYRKDILKLSIRTRSRQFFYILKTFNCLK